MVGTQSTGGIIIALMVVAQVALPHGGNVLVHVHLLTQRHHQEDAWKSKIKSLVPQNAIVNAAWSTRMDMDTCGINIKINLA